MNPVARRRNVLSGYLFISPWLIGFLLFTAGPMLASIGISFTSWSMLSTPSWVGLANYERIFTEDPLFLRSLGNTAYYVAFSVPLTMVLALGLALLLNRRFPASGYSGRSSFSLRSPIWWPSPFSGSGYSTRRWVC